MKKTHKQTEELLKRFWNWVFNNQTFFSHAIDGNLCIYRKIPSSTEEEFFLDFIGYDLGTITANNIGDYVLPKLTALCYDPSIKYDHELDQWCITLHNWTSGSSKDSPVEYCKEANEIPLGVFEAVLKVIEK